MSLLDDVDALVPPAFYHCPEYAITLGPEVADMVTGFGRVPNPEQAMLLDGDFGMDRRGRLTVFESLYLAARQNMKTGYLEFRALGKAIILKRPMQVWTAHKETATDGALKDFRQMIEESADLSSRIKAITEGKGGKSIQFVNGCEIVFRPRTGKAGQSMSADDVDLDEYFAVEPKHMGSLLPTLSTRPHAQVGGASSAPHATSNSLRSLMARGRAAAEGRSHEPRLHYAEWSIQRRLGTALDGTVQYGPPPCKHKGCNHMIGSVGCIADDRELIKLANPSAGRSQAPAISWDYLADERRSLSADAAGLAEYFRERLSSGDEGLDITGLTIFGPAAVWKRGGRSFVADGVGAVGVAMSADRKWIGLTGASMVEAPADEDDPEGEPIDLTLVAPILHTTDIEAATAELKRIQDEHDCIVVMDENGPAASLLEDLEDADVAVETATLREYAKASSKFSDGVTRNPPTTVHLANDELDQHVAGASWKWVGDNRIISRRSGDDSIDITLLEAAILAAQQAERTGTFNVY